MLPEPEIINTLTHYLKGIILHPFLVQLQGFSFHLGPKDLQIVLETFQNNG